MINAVILSGRLTADPELKTTQSGIAVTAFSVAVNRPKRKDEEQQTDFVNIVAWRQTAEFVSHYFRKGNLIGIEGSIQARKYEDRDGNKRTAFEVLANRVHFLETKRDGAPQGDNIPALQNAVGDNLTPIGDDDELPF